MKVVILAGGLGTRLAEETEIVPKPMVEVGHRPLIWHIMKHYANQGHRDFLLALGYKGEQLKRFFLDYALISGDLTVSLADRSVTPHGTQHDDWTVNLIDTGFETQTGGRLGRLKPWLEGERFMLTYGDGVSNIDLKALLAFHEEHGKMVTVTAVRPPSRFGGITIGADGAVRFVEKPQVGEGWVNGGFMVMEPGIFGYIASDDTVLEHDVLEKISSEGELRAFEHREFWQCVDTLRDLRYLRSLWSAGDAPWVTWS